MQMRDMQTRHAQARDRRIRGEHRATFAIEPRARRIVAALLLAAGCILFAARAPAQGSAGGLDPDTEIGPFAEQVANEHGLDAGRVRELLAGARVLEQVLAAIRRPAEAKPWRDYRPIFVNERRIDGGVAFWRSHQDVLARARRRFGVAERVIVAIIGVETFYGERAGSIRVLDALATLGFRYPRRAEFFRRELGHYLALGREEGLALTAVRGSYAGAMGIPQFIPSSYRAYAVDFDGDGRRDLVGSVDDAIGSVGAYLARHGWVADAAVAVPARVAAAGEALAGLVARGLEPHSSLDALAAGGIVPAVPVAAPAGKAAVVDLDGDRGTEHWLGFRNFYVITRYNRSPLYAMAVHQLAEAIAARRSGG